MQPKLSNVCPTHNSKVNYYCPECKLFTCSSCLESHKCQTEAKTVDEELLLEFKFEKYLGEGNHAKAFQVLRFFDGKKYALKIFKNVNLEEFSIAEKEMELKCQINHPNVVWYFTCKYLAEKKIMWIAMELCASNLEGIIENLEFIDVVTIFRQICKGVQELHSKFNICHGNLKLENVLIDEKYIAKVCDYRPDVGLQKKGIDLSNLNIEFLSPEAFLRIKNNEKIINTKESDVWALGMILLKLLTKNKKNDIQSEKNEKEGKILIFKEEILEKSEISSIKNPKMLKILKGCLKKTVQERMKVKEILDVLEENWNEKEDNNINIDEKEWGVQKTKNLEKNKKVTTLKFRGCWHLAKTLKGHSDWVNSLQFSPLHESLLLSCSHDKKVMLWDLKSGKIQKTLVGHASGVFVATFSRNGNLIASGGLDCCLKLWIADSGKLIKSQDTGGPVWSLLSSHNNEFLFNFSGKKIQIRDSKTGNLIRKFHRRHENNSDLVRSISQSPDGKILVSDSNDCSIKLWDISTGEILKILEPGHSKYVQTVTFSHYGKMIASGSFDTTIKLWRNPYYHSNYNNNNNDNDNDNDNNNHNDNENNDNNDGSCLLNTLKGHTFPVYCLCFSPDDSFLISGSSDKTIKFWDLSPKSYNSNNEPMMTLETGSEVISICLLMDGRKLASGHSNGEINIWEC